MGKFNSSSNSQIVQELQKALAGESLSQPAYWNGFVYFSAFGDVVKAFTISNGQLSTTPASTTPETFSATALSTPNPIVSSNGTSNGILWAVGLAGTAGTGTLYAYDATNLSHEFYNRASWESRCDGLGLEVFPGYGNQRQGLCVSGESACGLWPSKLSHSLRHAGTFAEVMFKMLHICDWSFADSEREVNRLHREFPASKPRSTLTPRLKHILHSEPSFLWHASRLGHSFADLCAKCELIQIHYCPSGAIRGLLFRQADLRLSSLRKHTPNA
jgi:hypothetical protein